MSFLAYRCTCVDGFANGVCEYTKNPLRPSKVGHIALYHRTCIVMESMANRNSTKLTGNCDIDVDECKSFPCKNGATCTDSTTESAVSYHAYQCTCVAGFANGVCEYKKNPKEKSPNKDHDFIKEYKTQCTVKESMANPKNVKLGGNCDIDVNECASKPCKNCLLYTSPSPRDS